MLSIGAENVIHAIHVFVVLCCFLHLKLKNCVGNSGFKQRNKFTGIFSCMLAVSARGPFLYVRI